MPLLRRHRTDDRDSVQDRRDNDEAVGDDQHDESTESILKPAKVMRIGVMVRQLLDEVRLASLDEAGRARLREIHEQSIRELASALSADLVEELDRMARPFDALFPSESELRVAQAQLVGWLEGLFHGIQAAVFAQQLEAQMQLDQMRQNGPRPVTVLSTEDDAKRRSSAYL